MKKLLTLAVSMIGAITLFAGVASAHVSVQPQETSQGKYEVFTLRVPSESEVPTTKVEVKFPEEVDITRFEPKAGWTYEVQKDDTGKITSVRGQQKEKVYLQLNSVSLTCKEKWVMRLQKSFGKHTKLSRMEV